MNDLISRQAAIELIRINREAEYKKSCSAECEHKSVIRSKHDSHVAFCDYLIEQIKNMLSTQQWIPCSERPPEESGDYLVTVAHHSGELWVEVDQFDNENGSWWHYMDDVTAWMPRPEPYKGEES